MAATIYAWVKPFWMAWLVLVFAAIAVWAFWPSRKKSLEKQGEIPLRDDPET
jgi:cytochrome c oxidase cbb3-type subunit IV